CHQYYTTPHSF
nr:immunoglobulin light chain junction region [Macaca mulatta]MPN91377.1 immunoglobulin light chain junction region [Macaca mulatta]MPN91458.1 immunoglobulin light chain junction region [Macaca mulatta]MPN91523.1 immunoglobulin light chain junction region [Macaca mulatta]MPN91535.1 immunoglobulin light chain junction region [Macaca mulatta]